MTPHAFIMLLSLTTSVFAASLDAATCVAHPGVGKISLSEDDVSEILLGRKTTWPNGSRIILICPPADSTTAETAYKEYLRKSPTQFNAYWKRLVFTGKGSMPSFAKTDAEVAAKVAQTPGAFGITDKATDTVVTVH